MTKSAHVMPDLTLAIRRGAAGFCPCCGKGRLFRSYLKQVDQCAVCGTEYGDIRADDGPTWLTVLIVGHVVVALALAAASSWSTGFGIAFFSTLAVVMSLALLPVAKGIFIAIIWSERAAGA